uniref:Uncharacterized protein n=1 Tax=Anguilla anguilla TaxID=7936 RepID=A0A0E9SLI5_ANGAN
MITEKFMTLSMYKPKFNSASVSTTRVLIYTCA